MSIFQLHVNGRMYHVDIDGNMPLLWAIRDILGLKGTKFGCGVAQCGACTVHLTGGDGVPRAVRSCSVDVGVAQLSHITTIEGLSYNGGEHPCQTAWVEDHERRRPAQDQSTPHRRRDRRGHARQHLPLRNLSTNSRSDS